MGSHTVIAFASGARLPEARRAGLSPDECAAIVKIDWVGLELATRSFAKKRRGQGAIDPTSLIARVQNLFLSMLGFFSIACLGKAATAH